MPQSKQFKIIAMDGGAAVGKSSTSRGLAECLDLMHVDTGAHYRTLTYAFLATGADPSDQESIPPKLAEINLDTQLEGRSAKLSINGQVPSEPNIRSAEVNATVSQFAAIETLRTYLFEYQRDQADLARQHGYAGLIMEGRDIGSVIFPDADYRFFLYADEATRAARRAKEGQADSITARDKMDKGRKAAPLICPEGAIRIDTAPHTLEEVIEKIAHLITQDGLLT